jgi:hybrid cluster-associated redox disulfide protein
MLVSDVLAAAPAAAGVFVRHRMGCVGCAFARFETVGEVAEVYGLDPQELTRSVEEVLSPVKGT